MSQSDKIDDVLSDFFKSKMRHPWPAAPVAASVEPARRPAAYADQGNRARFTLAASVAILIGTCWYFTNGSNTDRVAPKADGPSILGEGSAKMPKEFEKKAAPKPALPTGPMLN